MSLRDFQIQGSEFLQGRDTAFLCDDAGLGKSATVLHAAGALGLSRVLCVGPAVAGVSWPIQIKTWSPSRTFVDLDTATTFGFDLPGFYFVSYDTLSQQSREGLVRALSTCVEWDLLIIDEGQYLKNFGARRTRAVYGDQGKSGGIADNVSRAWVLSGTLTPNHAGEAYTHLVSLFCHTLETIPAFKGRIPEQHEFEDYFCRVQDTVYGRVMQGSKNQNVLREALKPVLMRRLKSQVMPELPPMEWFTAPIIVTRPQDFDGVTWDAETAFKDDQSMGASVRRKLGIAKVPGCVSWIEDRIKAGEPKIIVFAHHTAVLDMLAVALGEYSPVLFDGRTSHADRAKVVHQFQNDPARQIFIGQAQAAGTAITLTAARTVFFVEFAGTPGNNYQAASRAHRMGQRDGVQVYFAMVPNSLDEKIAATAARRAREIAELFD